jgi:hypothetical protein
MPVIRTLEEAAAWIDEVGLALLFPKADVVLPSLWEQVNGSPEPDWAVRNPGGDFVRWSDEMAFLWSAKDELPAAGFACVGKHLARVTACVAPRLVPVLVAASGEPTENDPIVEAITEHGPLTGPLLRELTGLPKKVVDRTISFLHHGLVLTSSHLVEGDGAWGALAHDLLARKWRLARKLPVREAARCQLATLVLEQAEELSAADLAGVFCWRRAEAAEVLDAVGEAREEDGIRIWTRR